ncbi:MAG: hypothetical protein M1829_001097 [Trizodia sp. TS-e1964]|nr:MAG: hypothetical protein M1829_001097 [Trizodia sp. TS-e1964]
MPSITSNNDLPKSLNTLKKQAQVAKTRASKHLGIKARSARYCSLQENFSRTLVVNMVGGSKAVVQFRTEPLNLAAFGVAREKLGILVPQAIALEDDELYELRQQGVWVYLFTHKPGETWQRSVAGQGAKGRVAVNQSLGQVFSKGCIGSDSREAVAATIQPHLDAILSSNLTEIDPYRGIVQGFLDKLEDIATLPLWLAHYDLGKMNIMIDANCAVTGLIDWELSTPLPFGEFVEAETAFWRELFDGMPKDVCRLLKSRKNLVQDAVILGTILQCFFYENGKVICGDVSLKVLPKFITYRIPLIRGNEPPYESGLPK